MAGLCPAIRVRDLTDEDTGKLRNIIGRDIKVDASIAKVYGTETAGRVVDRCIQILGGMGVAQELPLERWYREMRIKRIGEGPSEVHRMVIARDMLGARRTVAV